MTSPAGPDPGGAVLGIDPGTVRVGLAASDPTRTIATPIASLARDDSRFWTRLDDEVESRRVQLVVVGLPRRLDGTEGTAAASAHALASEIEQRTGLKVVMWDERFTTAQAERDLISAGVRRRRRRETVDAAAAALLLQSWLDAARRQL